MHTTTAAGRPDMARRPFVEKFSSGYVQRVVHLLPKQGDRDPWRQPQRYDDDRALLLDAPIEDGVLQFTRIGAQRLATR